MYQYVFLFIVLVIMVFVQYYLHIKVSSCFTVSVTTFSCKKTQFTSNFPSVVRSKGGNYDYFLVTSCLPFIYVWFAVLLIFKSLFSIVKAPRHCLYSRFGTIWLMYKILMMYL